MASSTRPATAPASVHPSSPAARVLRTMEREKEFTPAALTPRTLETAHKVALRKFDDAMNLLPPKRTPSGLSGRAISESPARRM